MPGLHDRTDVRHRSDRTERDTHVHDEECGRRHTQRNGLPELLRVLDRRSRLLRATRRPVRHDDGALHPAGRRRQQLHRSRPARLRASVSATGTGQAPAPVCQLSATSIELRRCEPRPDCGPFLTVTNTGGSTLSGALTASCSEFAIVGAASCSLGPLESATFTLRFEPTALGDSACTLDVGASCGTVGLHGRGAPPPECQLSALTHDFGQAQWTAVERLHVRDQERGADSSAARPPRTVRCSPSCRGRAIAWSPERHST